MEINLELPEEMKKAEFDQKIRYMLRSNGFNPEIFPNIVVNIQKIESKTIMSVEILVEDKIQTYSVDISNKSNLTEDFDILSRGICRVIINFIQGLES